MSDNSDNNPDNNPDDNPDDDYKTICKDESTDKCVICEQSLFPYCGPYNDEKYYENEIVIACENKHRFHRGCIRYKVGDGSVYCPFPGCKEHIKNIEDMEVVDYDTLGEEYDNKINEKKGGRRKRKSVRKTRKHKRRTYKRRTHKRRTYRRK